MDDGIVVGVADGDVIGRLLAALAVVLVVARLAGAGARRLGQPPVVGEIAAGILLGPTLLGALPGDLTHVLFPLEVRPLLGAVAQLGLVLFMFLVGLELDLAPLRGRLRLPVAISLSSVAVPLLLGLPLGFALYRTHGDPAVTGAVPFALFVGAAFSITAFPVLARILAERGMAGTPLGSLVLACAAVDDVLAWSLLTVVVALVAAGGFGGVLLAVGGVTAVLVVLVVVARPLLVRATAASEAAGRPSSEVVVAVLALVLAAAWATDAAGVHTVFGAFAVGAVVPKAATGGPSRLAGVLTERVEAVTAVCLPAFFFTTGLAIDLRSLAIGDGIELVAILAVAVLGKFGGAAGAARLLGEPGHRAATIGVLMNTRGLTELVLLDAGRQLGVLDPELFAMLVVMALVTTAMTPPLLTVIRRRWAPPSGADAAAGLPLAVGGRN